MVRPQASQERQRKHHAQHDAGWCLEQVERRDLVVEEREDGRVLAQRQQHAGQAYQPEKQGQAIDGRRASSDTSVAAQALPKRAE